jgi:cytochrome c-type biogenesis protein CcmH/NrfF
MLEVCPSPQAELLRDSIRDLAAAGKSKNEIVAWTLARHGEEWRAIPRRSGTGLWAWIVPPLALLAASVWLARRGWTLRRTAPPPVKAGELSPADRARLEAELRELERIG